MSGPIGAPQWMYSAGEFDIGQSVKFNDDDSQDLTFTPSSDTSSTKKGTFSCWMKVASNSGTNGGTFIGAADGYHYGQFYNNALYFGNTSSYISTAAVFRDYSAWMNVLFVFDTTLATSADRMQIWVNGVRQSLGTFTTQPSQNSSFTFLNTTQKYYLGSRGNTYFDGYLADVYFIDGQALAPTDFAETVDGYWKAKEYDGTFGTNGWHLNFKDDVVSEGFNTLTYTGTGQNQSLSGLGFSPDLVWTKERNSTGWHRINDSVRGTAKQLYTNATNAEDTAANNMLSFDADGFTVGTDTSINGSGDTYVNWCWDAGSGSAASNTDGSVTSSVKANTSYGFSIVTYTATGSGDITVGHGLGVTPSLIIGKTRNQAYGWRVFHTDLGGTKQLALNSNAAAATANAWGQTNPTSSVFTAGRGGNENLNYASGDTVVCYCFAEVSGYSKISSYTGTGAVNNSVTGVGFEPAFLMVKRTDSTGWWTIFDNTRNPVNPRTKNLFPNADNAEIEYASPNPVVDFDSDGFTLQTTDGGSNASGGTYIYMAFADTREYAFWKDVSGNGNHWTPNALDYRDSLPDTPQNNFATISPIMYRAGQSHVTLSEGNLRVTQPNSTIGFANFAVDSGKWYWEIFIENNGTTNTNDYRGVINPVTGQTSSGQGGTPHFIYNSYAGTYRIDNGSFTSTDTGTAANPDVIGFAWDADNGYMTLSVNGVAGTTITGLTTGTAMCPYVACDYNTIDIINFGQDSTFSGAKAPGSYTDANGIGSFQYDPSSYLALCTSNLPTPTIVDGSQHFNTVLYTGDNADRNIDVGFKSDFVWLKHRNGASAHRLYDSVRGDGQTLFSNLTNAEYDGVDDGIDFTYANGFNIDAGLNVASYNGSGNTYATWNWKLGGTAVSNTDGTITSQVSAGDYASICTYSGNGTNGATVGHGLGKVPKLLIIKCTSTADNWAVGKGVGSNQWLEYARLNDTGAFTDGGYGVQFFNDTAPTSSVFSLGTINDVNDAARDYVAYAFADVEGACKIDVYTGNGSSDGPLVYTGGRPSFFLVKRTTGTHHWRIFDAARSTFNEVDDYLAPSNANAEAVGKDVDFVSNGVKIRTTDSDLNTSGGTYLFLCIMETPLKFANAR